MDSSARIEFLDPIGLIAGFIKWLLSRRKADDKGGNGRGGAGGNAKVGGNGTAIGGRGGRGGLLGSGGYGGSAETDGDGFAMGGDGGDAGIPWRPALGAPSPLERQPEVAQRFGAGQRDEYGLIITGRGGSGGDLAAVVNVNGYVYPILPLTLLLRLWAPDVLDAVDDRKPSGPQAFWDIVTQLAPSVSAAAERHVRDCMERTIPQGIPAPDPYVLRDSFSQPISDD